MQAGLLDTDNGRSGDSLFDRYIWHKDIHVIHVNTIGSQCPREVKVKEDIFFPKQIRGGEPDCMQV